MKLACNAVTSREKLNRTRNCAAIISHLHERGFSMNNSIDLLFRRGISLGMHRTFFYLFLFSFATTRVKAGAALLLARDRRSSFHDPFYISRLSGMMFCKSYFYNSSVTRYRCARCIVTPLAGSIAVHYHNCAFIVIALLQSVSASINKK